MKPPLASYRLQFTPDFTFAAAASNLSYLADLGIDTIYASPIFCCRQGSRHGYDVTDMNALNPELGTQDEFLQLRETARGLKLAWLQDIVPNHMAFDAQNPLLVDLLENCQNSRYFNFFDIDWEHFYEGLRGRVLAPFLGSFYGKALESGEIRIIYTEEGFAASYYDLRFPLSLDSYPEILTVLQRRLRQSLGTDHADFIHFLGVLYLVKTLASGPSHDRYEQIRFIKQTLWHLRQENPTIRDQLEQTLAEFNGQPGNPDSFAALDGLLNRQYFRLSFWKVATEELNYRRFFSINDLISLCIEGKDVFDHCHRLILKMVRQGHIDGLRVDHIDGLYNPRQYLERLTAAAPEAYVVVEKILSPSEELPGNWHVAGTTGYDFLGRVNALFCRKDNERRLSAVYHRFAEPGGRCDELAYQKKRLIVERHMMSDIDNLAHLLKNFASRYRYGSDLTRYALRRALIEVMVELPVYRTYLTPADKSDPGRRYLRSALRRALRKHPELKHELEFLTRILPLQPDRNLSTEEREQWSHFVQRFQQFTGPLMAKGVEDTLLYVYNRLLSLNEVGSSPDVFGISREEFHTFNHNRLQHWPHTMNATGTHDTKRGEDMRARLNVLSELPLEWERQLHSWTRLNRSHKQRVQRRLAPDKNDEYFLYQTLLGAWPLEKRDHESFLQRLKDYLIKAVREAKVHTGWLKPDNAYEDAYLQFAEGLLKGGDNNPFLAEFLPFQNKIAFFGMLNSLGQTLLKCTCPGLPDIYQGCELWDLSLVDPDNRRPVDYALRRQLLASFTPQSKIDFQRFGAELRSHWRDGRIKLFIIWRALQLRQELSDLFQKGDYLPLEVSGSQAGHLVVFARAMGNQRVLVAIPRFLTELIEVESWPLAENVWGDTIIRLPAEWGRHWQDRIGGSSLQGHTTLAAADLFSDLPVALLSQNS